MTPPPGWFSRRRAPQPKGPEEPAEPDPVDVVRAYHRATKHHVHRFADGPHDLDWETQPDPFRRYAGAQLLALEREPPGGPPWFEAAWSPGAVAPAEFDRAGVSRLFYDALALSAWKRYGDARWALRVNPSSGNLHPTEATLLAGAVPGLCERPLVAHYAPREHALEVRAEPPPELWERFVAGLPADSLLVGLSSIPWREAWKYGERAYRYCQHDVGHALAALAASAAALGWRARLVEGVDDRTLARLLGVWQNELAESDGAEYERAECVVVVTRADAGAVGWRPPADSAVAFEALEWRGVPNALSSGHVEWHAVRAVGEAVARAPLVLPAQLEPGPPPADPVAGAAPAPADCEPISLRTLAHQRRSCLALDGKSGLAADAFFQTLARTLPEGAPLVLGALPWTPRVHFLVFVHRVVGLAPGLYAFLRAPADLDGLRGAMRDDFEWAAPPDRPAELALFRLREADARGSAARASCQQAIAADGCFSLGMLARFEPELERHGARVYPRLFWECGVLGQLLYLEAEALGLRGTGIGCFFDDEVHALAGLRGSTWQSLYHFTVGMPVEDGRLTSEPAYP